AGDGHRPHHSQTAQHPREDQHDELGEAGFDHAERFKLKDSVQFEAGAEEGKGETFPPESSCPFRRFRLAVDPMPPTESAPASPPPAAPAASRASGCARRLVSTLGLWAVVIAAVVFAKGAPFFLVLGVLSFIGIREWVKMDPTLPRPWALG